MTVGLGTGRTAARAIAALGERVRDGGLEVRCVPTSHAAETCGKFHGLKMVDFAMIDRVDYLFDGADEVDSKLRMIKGAGGAMARERIVAHAAARRVYIVDESKLVEKLGQRATLGVCVLAFGLSTVRAHLRDLGLQGVVRRTLDGHLFLTDNGNLIIDVTLGERNNLADLANSIKQIAGVVDHGLFLTEADEVLVETQGGIERMERK
ncbi:MAG: ribose-5-phosphate isomerase RpiA [Phycisphaerales bacterium]|nr:ribose-5-phosphate isomerase RpiA [Phycisphaerales bacterium]